MSEVHNNDLHPGELDDIRTENNAEDVQWLAKARSAFDVSTDYLDSGIRAEWEDSLSRFHSEHPNGSKYHSSSYKKRSKIFRPKTRSAERRALSQAARALFSNSDLIDVRGQNVGSEIQAAAARVNKELLQYRLEHSIPWFITALGARQDTFNYGICVSLSNWKYEESESVEYAPAFDEVGNPVIDEEGNELGEEIKSVTVTEDRPVIDLYPPENLRLDPNCDWSDPVGTSPVITLMMSMPAGDVLQRMTTNNPVTGAPEWTEYPLSTILSANIEKDTNETVRNARQGDKRQDPRDTNQYNEYSPVWVYLVIMEVEGKDHAFYTLSNRLMLTKPVPVEELLPLGRDSLTVGFSVIEAHRIYPSGGNSLGAPLQAEINDVANQRMDNVKLALNKRYILRRGANVDQQALMRSVPGGGITAKDPDKDVRVMEYNDVTSSSYQEHDRLSQEQDELMGTFSGSSVQSNRALNETVGGMSMLQGDAASVAELELRTWVETWVEPVMRKLQKLEAMFETDEAVLAIAGENAEVFQRYGQDVAVDNLLDHELSISVNVGMGNTDPMQRVQKFQAVLSAAAQIPEVAQRMRGDEVGKEMFALGGYSEGERFFLTDEEWAQAQQQMAEQAQQPQEQDHSLEIEQMRSADRRYDIDTRRETEMEKVAANSNLKLKDLYERIGVDREKNRTQRDITALKEGNKSRELRIKQQMGSGI